MNWEFAICKVMTEIGFVQGEASLCMYRHFCKATPCVGAWRRVCPSRLHHKCQVVLFKVARVLGCDQWRNSWWTDEGISWEADPRHAELIKKSFGVTGLSVSTPGVKDRLDDTEG